MIFIIFYKGLVKFTLTVLGMMQLIFWSLVYRTRKRKTVPEIRDNILYLSARKLAETIRNQKITSLEVIQAYKRRCEEVNPILNAIVDSRFEEAIAEAKEVDELVKSGKYTVEEMKAKFPLLGIPLTVKESVAVKGLRNEGGVFKKNWTPASRDAEPVALARAAGAIPILVSNTPELCMCIETFNYVTGTTNNPYDIRRTPGGSSGGEAALLASAGSVIGIGSDIAGSLRTPAMYCGVYGLKPTAHIVTSGANHKPSADNPEIWTDFFSMGPMVRYAEDLQLLFDVIKKQNIPSLKVEKEVPVDKIRYFYIRDNDKAGITKVSDDVRHAMDKVIDYFENTKNQPISEAQIKYFDSAVEIATFEILQIEGVETVFSKPGNTRKWRSVTKEAIKKIFGCSKNLFTSIMYAILKKLSVIFPRSVFDEFRRRKIYVREQFMNLLREDGVMFLPIIPYTAHFHNGYIKKINDISYTGIFNVLGFPSMSCPLGLTEDKLPVGIQIIASPGCEYLLFSVAKELEKAFGGWVPPPVNIS